jgi:hypothetical protein
MEEKRDLILLDTAVDDRLTLLCVWGNWDRGVEDEKILAYSDPNIVIRRFWPAELVLWTARGADGTDL